MCYDIKILYETVLKRARRKNDPDVMKDIEKELQTFKDLEFNHTSAYSHPKLPVYTSENPYYPKLQHWGLIPFWTKNEQSTLSIQNKTLNARVETIFEKPAFRASAKNRRCLIYLDGFFEHHHFKGKTYPYFIYNENNDPLCLAGLWDEWVNIADGEIYNGFSIVTTKANSLMQKIHNNPKLPESRMPLTLTQDEEDVWLNQKTNGEDLNELFFSRSNINLKAYTVQHLKGKSAPGNVPEACNEYIYPELSSSLELDF